MQIAGFTFVCFVILGLSYIVMMAIFDSLPLTFWKEHTRLSWKNYFLIRRVARIEKARQHEEECKHLRGQIEYRQRQLVEYAYKDPEKFIRS